MALKPLPAVIAKASSPNHLPGVRGHDGGAQNLVRAILHVDLDEAVGGTSRE